MEITLMASPSGLFCKDLKKNKEVTHHFEWQFGVSAPSAVSPVFDWVGALREPFSKGLSISVLSAMHQDLLFCLHSG